MKFAFRSAASASDASAQLPRLSSAGLISILLLFPGITIYLFILNIRKDVEYLIDMILVRSNAGTGY